jgi:hypothetical protein
MRLKVLTWLALILLIPVSAPAAVDVGDDTVGWWSELRPNFRLPYLQGALEVLSGLGLACPTDVTVGQVDTLVESEVRSGRVAPDTAITLALLMTVKRLGCRFEGPMLGAVGAVMGLR